MNTKSFKTQHNSKLKDCSWTKVQSTVFSQFCNDNYIRQTMFRISGGSKTILAIAVRFNRTLRIRSQNKSILMETKNEKYLFEQHQSSSPKQELRVATVALLGNKVQRVASFFAQNGGPLFLSQRILNTEDDL